MTIDSEKTFVGNDCRVGWGERGLLLRFAGQPPEGVSVALPIGAPMAAGLLRQLQAALAEHEDSHGVVWSEQDARLGVETDRRTGLGGESPLLGPSGRQMYKVLKNLPLNGFERSFKMQPGALLAERFLLGIRRDCLAPEQCDEIVAKLGLPDACRAAFQLALPHTRFLHFGHEKGPDGTVRKLYQEFDADTESGERRPPLLYTGYKWNPEHPAEHSVSQYRLYKGIGIAEIVERMKALLPGHPDLVAAGANLVESAAARCTGQSLLYLDVSEADNPRHSCDINLYPAGMRVGECASLLAQAARCLGIHAETVASHLNGVRNAELGHISTGIGRNGTPFLTVYYCLPSE